MSKDFRGAKSKLASFLPKVAFESNLRKKLSRIEHVLIVKFSFERRQIAKVFMTARASFLSKVNLRKLLSKENFLVCHYLYLGHWARRWIHHRVCDVRSVRRQTYGCLPSCRAPSPYLDRYSFPAPLRIGGWVGLSHRLHAQTETSLSGAHWCDQCRSLRTRNGAVWTGAYPRVVWTPLHHWTSCRLTKLR